LLFGLLLALPIARPAVAADDVPADRPTVILVVGAGGEEEFGRQFQEWALLWEKAARLARAEWSRIGPTSEALGSDSPGKLAASLPEPASDRELVQKALESAARASSGELWLVLIGHGTFDGREAKFNVRGPDLSASDLEAWLRPLQRPTAVINCASSSAPFINKLSRPDRVIVTATRSGHELNFARFGRYLAAAIADPAADLDKDGQTSLLEAFLTAGRAVAEFYEAEGRLATEHPLIDDNGDGAGTPSDWFRGVRAVKKPADGKALDGLRAHQFHLVRSAQEQELDPATRARRDLLEIQIFRLRELKPKLGEGDYYARLEKLLVELAGLYEQNKASHSTPREPPK
jgi:hypothetical protein